MDGTVEKIAEFVMGSRTLEIPTEISDRARDIFVDTLGCAIGGRHCPAGEAADRFPTLPGQGAGGRVIGSSRQMAVDVAAFKNSAMIRYLDFNDLVPGNHPSDMLGGLVALSSRADVTGADFIRAVVVAYEVNARIAKRFPAQPRWTVDSGYSVAIGLVAGASSLLGLSADQVRNAVSFAATAGVPLRASRAGQLSHMKGFATALSVRDAIFHVHLAECGVTAPVAPFDGRHGLVELLTGTEGSFELEDFDGWELMNTRLKYWPVAYNSQTGIAGALKLRKQMSFDEVTHVVLRTNKFLWHESGSERDKWDPQTRETADHSLPYLFARALLDGKVDGSTFTPESIRDPKVLAFMQGIEVIPDDDIDSIWPDVFAIRVEATDHDGAVHSVYTDELPGSQGMPLDREQIRQKFDSLVNPYLGEGAGSAFEASWDVRSADSISAVLDAFIP